MPWSDVSRMFRAFSSDAPPPPEGWGGDHELRGMARASLNGLTNWSLAEDLRELFAIMACYNEGRSPGECLRLEVKNETAERVARWRRLNLGDPTAKGPVGFPEFDDDILDPMGSGPETLSGLRLCVGGDFAHVTYINNLTDTWIVIEQPGLKRTRMNFMAYMNEANVHAAKPRLKLL